MSPFLKMNHLNRNSTLTLAAPYFIFYLFFFPYHSLLFNIWCNLLIYCIYGLIFVSTSWTVHFIRNFYFILFQMLTKVPGIQYLLKSIKVKISRNFCLRKRENFIADVWQQGATNEWRTYFLIKAETKAAHHWITSIVDHILVLTTRGQ